ncbi:Predicted oxidoreductase, contains short-chain dehydrogenase (SDR) and DUF2520 domains [Cyclobacterium lianum]|uniref:Predicted oxidoreductase, contains short-chain dehydrogenase (SDR) and DUF2520 domains n=1 Tax=Cyclobacterium lianum TaxID=388280 RepID=A0A1M7JLY5_9BACT|nr:Predicted oxidoreductase, contains short-chain dehydrogenase (SDR) and DUF2520 domains [Cyclobacterium lianum]
MKFEIAILGTGNVAWHLSSALENAGHVITEIYGRDLGKAEKIAARLYGTEARDHLDFTESPANLYILAVSDQAIAGLAESIILPEESILVHTSGNVSLDILSYSSADYTGILYPLQSFTRGREIGFEEVPFLLETVEPQTMKILQSICRSMSSPFYAVPSNERKAIHVAAVFAANFTNHLIGLSEQIIHQHGLDFDMLKPLIVEQINKTLQMGATRAQTGPAIREDYETLEDHHDFLQYNVQLAEIYRLISQNIIDSNQS